MGNHAPKRPTRGGKAAVKKKDAKKAAVKKAATTRSTNRHEERSPRIVVLTSDPGRSVVIVSGCHIGSMSQEENAYFFEDGNGLAGMIVEGGTVEYRPHDRTYVVRLTNGGHRARR